MPIAKAARTALPEAAGRRPGRSDIDVAKRADVIARWQAVVAAVN